jgi:hypothetical protein
MTTILQPSTADDLLRMPDDGFRYELVKGDGITGKSFEGVDLPTFSQPSGRSDFGTGFGQALSHGRN